MSTYMRCIKSPWRPMEGITNRAFLGNWPGLNMELSTSNSRRKEVKRKAERRKHTCQNHLRTEELRRSAVGKRVRQHLNMMIPGGACAAVSASLEKSLKAEKFKYDNPKIGTRAHVPCHTGRFAVGNRHSRWSELLPSSRWLWSTVSTICHP